MPFRQVSILATGLLASFAWAASQPSPYAGEETRRIKALSADDVAGYLAGKGMGLAKAAELNGYAGPAHVLELGAQLALTPEQRSRTETLFNVMEASARTIGHALVEAERKLDELFASRTVDAERLARALQDIGVLQAKLRGAHLEAHLAQVDILTPDQNARYAVLRGYGAAATSAGPAAGGGHGGPGDPGSAGHGAGDHGAGGHGAGGHGASGHHR